VKLLFKSVIAACRSAGFNELIRSSVVGVGDGDAFAAGLVADGDGACEGTGDCAKAFARTNTAIPAAEINRKLIGGARPYPELRARAISRR
jgi:hypothetical protein